MSPQTPQPSQDPGGFLARIRREKEAEIAALRRAHPPGKLLARARAAVAESPRRDFAAALRAPGLSLIAELKRRSPSAGALAPDLDPAATARAYAAAGARALSVLTDGPHFGGALADLTAVRAASALPILRKDFLIDELQLAEAALAGADAVLLIVRLLDEAALSRLIAAARALSLAALVEVHDAHELDRALAAGAEFIGINNRDLDRLTVDVETAFRLRPRVPAGKLVIAESGLSRPEMLARLARAGFDGALVGEALLRGGDPGAAAAALLGGGR